MKRKKIEFIPRKERKNNEDVKSVVKLVGMVTSLYYEVGYTNAAITCLLIKWVSTN